MGAIQNERKSANVIYGWSPQMLLYGCFQFMSMTMKCVKNFLHFSTQVCGGRIIPYMSAEYLCGCAQHTCTQCGESVQGNFVENVQCVCIWVDTRCAVCER